MCHQQNAGQAIPASAGEGFFKLPASGALCDGALGLSRQSEAGLQVVSVGEGVSGLGWQRGGWQGCGPGGGDELVVNFEADDPGVGLESVVEIGARD